MKGSENPDGTFDYKACLSPESIQRIAKDGAFGIYGHGINWWMVTLTEVNKNAALDAERVELIFDGVHVQKTESFSVQIAAPGTSAISRHVGNQSVTASHENGVTTIVFAQHLILLKDAGTQLVITSPLVPNQRFSLGAKKRLSRSARTVSLGVSAAETMMAKEPSVSRANLSMRFRRCSWPDRWAKSCRAVASSSASFSNAVLAGSWMGSFRVSKNARVLPCRMSPQPVRTCSGVLNWFCLTSRRTRFSFVVR